MIANSESKVTTLPLELIEIAAELQMRVKLDESVVSDYADLYRTKKKNLPPADVFCDGSAYWLCDGFHRYFGAKQADRATLPVVLHKGTKRDAILFAAGANAEHGLRRSQEDKRKAVMALLKDEEWGAWTDRKIADAAGVSDRMVAMVRKSLEEKAEIPAHEERVGADGKTYRKSASRGKRREEPDEAECPHGGNHVYEEGACVHCDARLPSESPLDEILGAKDEVGDAAEPDTTSIEAVTKAWNAQVESFARSITAVLDNAPQGPWMDTERLGAVRQILDSAAGAARAAKYFGKPCPKCEGHGAIGKKKCAACRGVGTMPKIAYEMAGGN